MPTDETSTQPSPVRWRILGVTLAVGFMALLDVTIVNVAIPSMQSGLGTTTSTIQWVVSGYALAFGLTLVAVLWWLARQQNVRVSYESQRSPRITIEAVPVRDTVTEPAPEAAR